MTLAPATRTQRPPPPRAEWAYFLDLDGSLIGFADYPDGVRVDRELKTLLAALGRFSGGAVALISGRSIADLDRLIPDSGLPVAGQHGGELRMASGRMVRRPFSAAAMTAPRIRLSAAVESHPLLLLEDKGSSLAVHYRRAPRLAAYAHRLMRTLHAESGTGCRLLKGKHVVELAFFETDKEHAIRAFMREAPFRGRPPVFIGDDRTDEAGFAAVNRLGGLSIKVGSGRTVARWRLPCFNAVREWLRV